MKFSLPLTAVAAASAASLVNAGTLRLRQDAAAGPTDPGITKYCTWYTLSTADTDPTCKDVLSNWGITIEQFTRWNPSAGKDLDSCKLQAGHAYCVEARNEPTVTAPPAGPTAPGPTQSGEPSDCDRWDLVNAGDTCDAFTSKYPGLTLDQFVTWNPAVGATCTKLMVGVYVCTRTTGWVPSTNATPSPVQPGQVKDCTAWHFVQAGETCDAIAKMYKDLTQDDLVSYNPAIKKDCSGMWANAYLCVETKTSPKHPEQSGTPTTTPGAGGDQNPTPSPVQPGQTKDCTTWYFVQPGDTCDAIARMYKDLSVDTLVSFNPAIKKDCSGMWANAYLCVETKTSKHPIVTPTPTAGAGGDTIQTPSPVQPGQVKDCTTWYFVNAGDTCDAIAHMYMDLSVDTLVSFNPAIKKDCSGMWANAYLCVETKTSKHPKVTGTPTTGGGQSNPTPSPVQPGQVKGCTEWHFVEPGETCSDIIGKVKGLTLPNIVAWNPAVKSDCSGMWAKSYLCVKK